MRRPNNRSRWWLGVSAISIAFGMVAAGNAHGQWLKVSPGPLTSAHKGSDNVGGCFDCHPKKGRAVSCLGCHEHRELKADIEANRGLHGGFQQTCVTCHKEHQGRNAPAADWSKLGGKKGFRHKRTGFKLAGSHTHVKCEQCHTSTTASGNIRYVGLASRCASCHENVHDFRSQELAQNCERCHVVGGKPPKNMRGADVPFDHEKDAGLVLVGRHAAAKCVDCHKDKKMTIAEHRRTCDGCHDNPHERKYERWDCADCHHPTRRYKDVRFNHRKTSFAMKGKHKRVKKCSKCHSDGRDKPSSACDTCHQDEHRGRFEKFSCAQCHSDGGWEPSKIDHRKLAKFTLRFGHKKLACRNCHRGKGPAKFERHDSGKCQDCHQHRDEHGGKFRETGCRDCHRMGGRKKVDFDHNNKARFPLLGFHARVAKQANGCAKCHTDSDWRTGKLACVQCHDDAHERELGKKCDRCHTADVKFKELEFRHNELAEFPLEGLHRKLDCSKCHPDTEVRPRYKLGKTQCVQCHRQDDPHKGKFGDTCDTCHLVEGGAPLFSHERMTPFALTGMHEGTPCAYCHRSPPEGGAPPRGWTRGLRPAGVDPAFPVMGRKCSECHADQHGGRFGTSCNDCHNTTLFSSVRAAVHDTGAFSLRGVHNRLPCTSCHKPQRKLSGLGEMCQQCHWDDDRHNNGLGPYCGDCHLQVDWSPATKFSHVQTVFPLRGAHRTAPCEGCHGVGTYQGTPTECEQCHQGDAAAVSEPIHTPELRPCTRCHTELSFNVVRNDHPAFQLRGMHRIVRCGNCHAGGVYSGTPTDCENCHLSRYYDPGNQPNHPASGIPTTCQDCHSPAGWKPATQH